MPSQSNVDLYAISIGAMYIPEPARASLEDGGLFTVGDIDALSDDELLGLSGIGKVYLQHIRRAVQMVRG